MPDGKATVRLDFNYAGGGTGKAADIVLSIDGEKVGEGKVPATVFGGFGADTFGIGEDTGQPVAAGAYRPPFKFNGTIDQVVIDLR